MKIIFKCKYNATFGITKAVSEISTNKNLFAQHKCNPSLPSPPQSVIKCSVLAHFLFSPSKLTALLNAVFSFNQFNVRPIAQGIIIAGLFSIPIVTNAAYVETKGNKLSLDGWYTNDTPDNSVHLITEADKNNQWIKKEM
ncbi:hypothetical protein CFY87_10180 [Actinobacillus seminis]|uniref:Uncharacterized protein n=1 Tax=Actinobacillus seminis TaxID=722 RepID=A0ABX4FN03_9PAST|nr:hypothetical protein [Actinobacillus seminis]OZN24178.1 hypothetical protein CFY87_10180 [Actinobacillus seminis]